MDTNFGIINYRMKKDIKSIIVEGDFKSTKTKINDYTNLIQESKPLQVSYYIYKGIEGKYIPMHTEKYLDTLLESLRDINESEYKKEVEKLARFNNSNINIPAPTLELFEKINGLILEQVKPILKKDTKKIFDNYIYLVEYLKNDKKENNQKISFDDQNFISYIKENYIKENNTLDESDVEIFYLLERNQTPELEKKFTELKESILIKLFEEKEVSDDYKTLTINKIKEMKNESIKDNLIKLHLLNKNL